MNNTKAVYRKWLSFIYEFIGSVIPLFKTRYFYIGLITIIAGMGLNYASQTYLHYYMIGGKTLPMLSDLILDHLPVINVSLIYDLFSLFTMVVFVVYVIIKNEYNRVPYFLLIMGIFYIIRAIFIVLTPFGNPPEFGGSDSLFNGFARYELGVYPSGHIGSAFLLFLLVNDRFCRWVLAVCLVVITVALFLAHGHYSIDILSGLFFAYAIRSFGEKYLRMFQLETVITRDRKE